MSDVRASHHADGPARHPANRLGVDYRAAPPRAAPGPVVDIHAHIVACSTAATFFEAADHYGVARVLSMCPLSHVDTLRAAYPGRLEFVAVPRWRAMSAGDEFRDQWMRDLDAFRARGAARMKFWMAPPMRERHGLTLDKPFFEPVIQHALDLGYHFMVHIGDPIEWFRPGGKYEKAEVFGTKDDQYPQLEHFLERVAPRSVIGAHMGGSIESLDRLQSLLDRFPHYFLDTSATKWIVRGVAEQPDAVRAFIIRNQDRVLFGSDLVVGDDYNFDHYASRYWAHQTMWETGYRGESPIDDPDAAPAPRLAGVELPRDVLEKIYWRNAAAIGHGSAPAATR